MSIYQPIPAGRAPHFLAGPVERLRLSSSSALTVVVFGVVLTLYNLYGRDAAPIRWPDLASVLVTALVVAGLAARWFGTRVGMLAGLFQCSLVYSHSPSLGMPLAAAVTVAMGSFAAANVDFPRRRGSAIWLPWLFSFATGLSFIAGGWSGPIVILTGCSLFLIINQDVLGFRFFVSPLGIVLFALCIASASVPWGQASMRSLEKSVNGLSLPPMLLLWLPLAFIFLLARRGEGLLVQPQWRFVACWICAGCGMLFVGNSLLMLSLLPGLSIFLAVALVEILQRPQRRIVPYGCSIIAMASLCAGIALIKWLEPSALLFCMFVSICICLMGLISRRFASQTNSVQRSW